MVPAAVYAKAPPGDAPGRSVQPATIGIRRPANTAPTRWVVQRPQPTFGPMNPTATPPSAHSARMSVSSPLPLTQRGSSTAQATMTRQPGHERDGQPALRGTARPGCRRRVIGRAPRRGPGAGLTTYVGISYSDSAWRTARVCWRWASAAAVVLVRLELRLVQRARRPSRSPAGPERRRAGARTPGPGCEVTTIAVMPRRSRLTPVTSASCERRPAVRLHRGEQLEDLEPLPRAAVGGDDGEPVGADGEADRAVLGQRLVGDRRRGADGDLGRGVVADPGLVRRVEVQEDPRVGGLLEVELLDLDLARPGRRPPVDAVHRVARRVRPDRRRERRGLERALRLGVGALDVRRRQLPHRQRIDPGVDDEGDPLPHARGRLEEPERVAGPDLERLDPEVAAAHRAASGRASCAPGGRGG